MAKIKFSALVSEMSGKLNGSVIARGKNYTTVRNRVIPVNPNTALQSQIRQLFATISKNWSTLTETERSSWNSVVSQWIGTGIFADVKTLSGKALYQKLNNNLIMNGFLGISTPPAKANFTPFKITSATIDTSFTNVIGIGTLDGTNFTNPNERFVLKLSKRASAGTYNFQNLTKISILNANGLQSADFDTDDVIAGLELKGGVFQGDTYQIEIFALNISTGETTPSIKQRIVITEI